MKKLVNTAFFYSIAGMVGGVFYREFTKLNGFSGRTTLAFLHLHLFVLGMFFFLILTLLDKQFALTGEKAFGRFYLLYNCGMAITTATFLWRGIIQALEISISSGMDASISGIAGMGHILIGLGMIFFFVLLKKRIASQPLTNVA